MSEPTPGEQAQASAWGVPASQLAAARDALNRIATLDWPLPDRVHLVARLAKGAGADVGTVFAGAVLALAPLASFERVLPLPGVGTLRARGLARALGSLDLAALAPQAGALADAQRRVAELQAEVASLKAELNRVYAQLSDSERPPAAAPMRVEDLTQSLLAQVHLADQALVQGRTGLRLGGVVVNVQGQATQLEGELALDFTVAKSPSQLSLRFDAAGGGSAAALPRELRTVPDVTGYTETLARRKLQAQGLDAQVLRSAVAGAGGVVRRQAPEAGMPVPDNAQVRVVIG
ncbi:PASTA domain-containing protein [Burkholderiales bacterium JOSHI_001]|nr:PASTA domain-containing protein [Burkholderiales bacterium JOSHI_001]